MSIYWGNRGHCPKCGRFCGNIRAALNDFLGLFRVTGTCSIHGDVDLSDQDWSYDEFCDDDM